MARALKELASSTKKEVETIDYFNEFLFIQNTLCNTLCHARGEIASANNTDTLRFPYELFRNAFVFMTMKTPVVIFFGVLLAAILVFVVCIIIDIPRHYLFKWIKLKDKVQKIENKVMTKLNKKSEKI